MLLCCDAPLLLTHKKLPSTLPQNLPIIRSLLFSSPLFIASLTMALLRGIKSISTFNGQRSPHSAYHPAPGIDENYRKLARYIEATKEVNLAITIRIHGADFAGMDVHILCPIFLDGRAAVISLWTRRAWVLLSRPNTQSRE